MTENIKNEFGAENDLGGPGRQTAHGDRARDAVTNRAQWTRIEAALDEIRALPETQWPEASERLAGGDTELLAAIKSLLACSGGIDPVLDRPVSDADPGLIGKRFGSYGVLALLGHGGMGSVWLAERVDGLFARQVALKLVQPALIGRVMTERFTREREILASLNHPNIARLLDAGFAEDGQPYLALEYVEGTQLTTYCDDRRLSIRARLELFLQVLGAVQYAHAHLVIHRDLKPANILVTAHGQAQLLDFGIAKLLTQGQAKETELTQMGGRALTPDYAAPEQIAGAPITTAADVYALGVMLYELLTGERPYKLKRDSRGALEEAILRADPVAPSRAALSEAAATARSTTAKKLSSSLRGDLDTIVTKALKKSPTERYATANAFGEDIARFLSGDVVLAQPDSVAYRARKFARRHWIGITVTGVLMLTLAGGLAATSYEAKVASAQRDVARTEAATSDRTTQFMVSLFQLADPSENRGNAVTVKEVLDKGAKEIQNDKGVDSLAREPRVRAELLTAMGEAYYGLGLYKPAGELLAQASDDIKSPSVPDQARVRTLIASGRVLYFSGDYDKAAQVLGAAVDLARRHLDRSSTLRSKALSLLADVKVQLGDYAEAEKLCYEALAADRKRGPEEAAVLAQTLESLGTAYFYGGDLVPAERAMRETLELRERTFGMHHPDTARALQNLGVLLYQSGRYDEALKIYQQALPIHRELLGDEHPEVATVLNNIGRLELMAGRVDEAEPLLRQSLAMTEKFEGATHDDLVSPLNSLAMIDAYRGRTKAALAEIERAESIARLPDQGELLDQVLITRADIELSLGNRAAAARSLAEGKELLRKAHPESPTEAWRYAVWDSANAPLLAAGGDSAAAGATLASAREVLVRRFGENGLYTLLTKRRALAISSARGISSPETAKTN